jgi:hypothetical protein
MRSLTHLNYTSLHFRVVALPKDISYLEFTCNKVLCKEISMPRVYPLYMPRFISEEHFGVEGGYGSVNEVELTPEASILVTKLTKA